MKRRYTIPFLLFSLCAYTAVKGQTVDDALIFSKRKQWHIGTVEGLGNAQTALGGDISSINGNPAGLGFFGRSDISITLNYLRDTNKTNYLGNNSTGNKGNFGVDQIGIVFHLPTRNSSGWQNFNMGLSYNKTQNFNTNLNYEGINSSSSIVHPLIDIMESEGNVNFRDDFYNSYMVDELDASGNIFYPISAENVDKNQHNEHIIKGNRAKTAVAFGANYDNRFYIGATLGITSFRYDKKTSFVENGWTKTAEEVTAINPNSVYLDKNKTENKYLDKSYELFDDFSQSTEGAGIDLKLGMIYKPATDWNIGLTVTTPTWTTIKEDTQAYTDINYYEDATSDHPFPDNMQYRSNSYDSSLDYNLISPWKFSVGLSKFFAQGLISADVELINYSSMKYQTATNGNYLYDDFQEINAQIKDTYRSTLNFRIGGEYLFSNVFSGRAGFNYSGNPYRNADGTDMAGSIGLGIKLTNALYLDIAADHQLNSYKEAAYLLDEQYWNLTSPVADIDHSRTNFVLTLGAKF